MDLENMMPNTKGQTLCGSDYASYLDQASSKRQNAVQRSQELGRGAAGSGIMGRISVPDDKKIQKQMMAV